MSSDAQRATPPTRINLADAVPGQSFMTRAGNAISFVRYDDTREHAYVMSSGQHYRVDGSWSVTEGRPSPHDIVAPYPVLSDGTPLLRGEPPAAADPRRNVRTAIGFLPHVRPLNAGGDADVVHLEDDVGGAARATLFVRGAWRAFLPGRRYLFRLWDVPRKAMRPGDSESDTHAELADAAGDAAALHLWSWLASGSILTGAPSTPDAEEP